MPTRAPQWFFTSLSQAGIIYRMSALFSRLSLVAAMCVVFSSQPVAASLSDKALVDDLRKAAPTLDRKVLENAVSAMRCAIGSGIEPARRLGVIDFSLPSSTPRLWVFDLKKRTLLHRELVAHGQNSGDQFASRFSNKVGSHQSSIGLFRTEETYQGKHGYSLRLDGLEPGFNDMARERAIVIHGADYVDARWIDRQGRIGRSQGCPAVAKGVVRKVVDSLKGGQFMFSYYPDQDWLASSAMLNCEPNRVAAARAGARHGS